jgi:hypothetical protein
MCIAPPALARSARRHGRPKRMTSSRKASLVLAGAQAPRRAVTRESTVDVSAEPQHLHPATAMDAGQGRPECVQLNLLEALPPTEANTEPTTESTVSAHPVGEIAGWWDDDESEPVYRPARSRQPQRGWRLLVFRLTGGRVNLARGRPKQEQPQGITVEASSSPGSREAFVAVMAAESDIDSGALAQIVASQTAVLRSETSGRLASGSGYDPAVLDVSDRPSLAGLDQAGLVLLAASATLEGAVELDRVITVLEEQRGVDWVRRRVAVVLNGTRERISPSIISSYIGPRVRAVHSLDWRRKGRSRETATGVALEKGSLELAAWVDRNLAVPAGGVA